jgi:glutathione gamma-glutamylcysteinyltransferase
VSLDTAACLGRCNGAEVNVFHADMVSEQSFREKLRQVCSSSDDERCAMICAYSRQVLGQSGEGHFSPIGGYHPASDHVLIMDVARFKYPAHW